MSIGAGIILFDDDCFVSISLWLCPYLASAVVMLIIIATNTVLICPPFPVSSVSEMSVAREFICVIGATPDHGRAARTISTVP